MKENPNLEKSIKPISAINTMSLMQTDRNRRMPVPMKQNRMVPTGNLALQLADKATKYSKMFSQEA